MRDNNDSHRVHIMVGTVRNPGMVKHMEGLCRLYANIISLQRQGLANPCIQASQVALESIPANTEGGLSI